MSLEISKFIVRKRRALGYTQQNLADFLSVSFQTVASWENGLSLPEVSLLPRLAWVLDTSVDVLVAYQAMSKAEQEKNMSERGNYKGVIPNDLCYEIMRIKPPTKPYRVLEIGCGEGRDAIFFAQNGYRVSAFDISDECLEKARSLAEQAQVEVDFFKADIHEFKPVSNYDIIYSTGAFHYLPAMRRSELISDLKKRTSVSGINAITVLVDKPFIERTPEVNEIPLQTDPWVSGELNYYYQDWLFHKCDEVIYDSNRSGIFHRHCMDILIAEKRTNKNKGGKAGS